MTVSARVLPTPELRLPDRLGDLAPFVLEVEVEYGGEAPLRGTCGLNDIGGGNLAGGFFIGRLPGNDVVLPVGVVSKYHARVDVAGTRVYVLDRKSASGVFVASADGPAQRVMHAEVRPYDAIVIGGYRLRVGIAPR